MRLGALLVAAFGGAVTLTTAADFQIGGGLAFGFARALGPAFIARTSPHTAWHKVGPRSPPRHSPHDTWFGPSPSRSIFPDVDAQFLAQTQSPLQDLHSISLGAGVFASIRSVTRCARSAPLIPVSVGRFISTTDRRPATLVLDRPGGRSASTRMGAGEHRARDGRPGRRRANGVRLDQLPPAWSLRRGRWAATAWIEAKQHRNQTTAYGIASQELPSIATEPQPGGAALAAFVGQAEEAIPREHTLWRASRGLRDGYKPK